MTARQTALAALIACRKQGAWSDGILKEYLARDALDRRDAALASRLCYGVLQNRMLLDHYLKQVLTGRIKDLQPVVLDILRLGAYQMLLLDKIPASAAVNESVNLCKKYANHRAASLVNGVLRTLDREKNRLKPPEDLPTKYSHPAHLVALMEASVGQAQLEAVLKADNETPQTAVQINILRARTAEIQAQLQAGGAEVCQHPWMPDCLLVSGAGSVELLAPFQQGECYVQDPAARLAAEAAGILPGMTVLDACAAPGGKSFVAAIGMRNEGSIFSCDLHPHKIDLLTRGAARLGLTCIHPVQQDATAYRADWEGRMDAVLADVPCSGLGIIRKKPDIRYENLLDLQQLPQLQLQILQNVARYVRPGGVLLYSTCTILHRENEEVVRAFLWGNDAFALEPMSLPVGGENAGMLTLLPGQYDTDGFFICKMRRRT
ncbi:MAG: 16S rRNA (cytosine(967)-C(5))-methyltransferase RsmB [Clostridiales bacterium]|nr:16S rRNA (cytosine(967)-C(5))-methyltransferase RsmB [Clostridiales bacterium]